MKWYSKNLVSGAISLLAAMPVAVDAAAPANGPNDLVAADMVLVRGGTFEMGDVFSEGLENERPVHTVTLSSFFISKYEVTVDQFREFIAQTGYKTSAEAPDDAEARADIMATFASGELSREEIHDLKSRLLEFSGAGYWDAERRVWTGYNPETNWTNPGIRQSDHDPVLAVSVDDARHYCNWLSRKSGLPVAYDLETGDILDGAGQPTRDITAVKGYRLPTEAEWEFAAREGGRKVRFGNGKDVARSSQMNFCGDSAVHDDRGLSGCAGTTKPVGSYPPNELGLYDMSGNAWEWVSDNYAEYRGRPQENPYIMGGNNHALRGGRWGGDANEARVSHRSSWPKNDRCNNSGFRVARSMN